MGEVFQSFSPLVLYAAVNAARMQVNFPLLRRNVLRAIAGRPQGLEALAEREWRLCEEETVVTKPAIYLDGALEKVEGLSPWRTWDIELPMVRGGVGHRAEGGRGQEAETSLPG